MSSPMDRGFACPRCGLRLAPGAAQCPRCGAPQWGPAPGPAGAEPLHPAVTAIITVFFSLFGLIPCLISAGRARRLGRSTRSYWLAFWIPEGIWLALAVIMAIGMFAGFGVLARGPAESGKPGGATPSPSRSYSTTAPSSTSSGALDWPVGATECSSTAAAGNERTSCEFALNVAGAWGQSPRAATQTVEAYSPVTNRSYAMSCTTVDSYTTCVGGDGAVVYVRG
ncbi:zinc ribbon domain-containing protein [uncultured Propionibacterium sp.]|uniref:zinc ribbon domain-containing protein n=1 Tax=uncultured Propionibacterium sp. TaxID=218066 RepID=UPI00292E37F4|nr:zinc ribbon domain-containing protein [uncultured Propionibacterium sp.]